MKRIVSLLLTLTLAVGLTFSLASCKNGNQIKINPDKEHYVVGVIQLAPHPALDAATEGFKAALSDALAKEGRTVEFKVQNAQGESAMCSTIVNSFVSEDVDLIMANATAALVTAYNATETIPILGTSITEYGVALSLNGFNGVVGANVSGTSDLAPLTEQAQMMIDTLALQAGAKVGLLYCSAEPNSLYQVDVVEAYLQSKGMACTRYAFTDSNDLQTVATTAANNCDAIYVPTDNTVATNAATINNVCADMKIPVFAGEEGICSGCGYATLSISYYNIGAKTGEMAAAVLLGQEDITEMAIAYDEAPVKKYNEAACINLGIDVDALVAAGYVMIEGTEATE